MREELSKVWRKHRGREGRCACEAGNGGKERTSFVKAIERLYVQGNFGTVTFPILLVNH